jgi:small-conductance mechanosensitive channel
MKAGEVYRKTIQFCWLKLLVGILHIIVAGVLLAILVGLSALFKSQSVTVVMFLIWLSLLGTINFIFKHYLGYLLKAGHVAVIARAFRDGTTPDAPFRTGAQMVKQRFGTANVYFVIDKLVAGAVKQLQKVFGRVTNMFKGVPGMDALTKLGQMFIDISLGYVDECCLGYTFYNDTQNAYKSAADGVVIYAQNWKVLLKNAAVTVFVVILAMIVVTVASMLLFIAVFRLFGLTGEWSGIAGFVLGLFTAYAIKYAFIDTWIMVKMMSTYMEVAPTTKITFDLYGKLRGMSPKFGELLNKAGKEPSPLPVADNPTYSDEPPPPKTCPQCGAVLAQDTKFCGACGSQIS